MKYLLGLFAIGALFAAINQAHAEDKVAKKIGCHEVSTQALGSAKDISCEQFNGSQKEKCLELLKHEDKNATQERAS